MIIEGNSVLDRIENRERAKFPPQIGQGKNLS
jgi:hypothetical protein